ncbi:MAG: class I SAM-dependent methyltransferase [Phascolarctobacterium sp.]|nr:class I SAM-dependent methyltransferase [Phascolarctobacterium sp.]
MRFAVTAGRKGSGDLLTAAKEWATHFNVPYLERASKGSLEELRQQNDLDAILVATADGPQIYNNEGTFFYHPGMAVLRLQRLKNNEHDHFAQALELGEGMRVLDGTLGLAGDAAIASYLVGEKGKVVGVEASLLLHFVVENGLRSYEAEDIDLTNALRRIATVQATAEEYLETCAENSFDVVYFDPMFRYPVQGSSAMEPLRPVAYEKPLNQRTIELALKAAPKVVIKERSEKILREYGCTEILGGRYSRIKFGIIRR